VFIGVLQLVAFKTAEKRASSEIRAHLHAISMKYWEGPEGSKIEKPPANFRVFEIKVRNFGKSMAKNIQISFCSRIATIDQVATFNGVTAFDAANRIMNPILPTESDTALLLINLLSESDISALGNRETHTIYVFGEITFEDSLGKCVPIRFIYTDQHRLYGFAKGPLFQFPQGNYQKVEEWVPKVQEPKAT